MTSKDFIVDLSLVDIDHPVADIEEIRRYNPQRHEMEQLTAVVYEDTDRHACVGYKDVGHDEFWARGHMPGLPIMPGILLCEAAAQLASFHAQKHDLLGGSSMVGFGGLEDVRFRDLVFPGSRLFIAIELVKARRNRLIVCRFEEFVDDRCVVTGTIKGIPLPVDFIRQTLQQREASKGHRQG